MCDIKIAAIVGLGTPATSVGVTGRVSDCAVDSIDGGAQVSVTLNCGGNSATQDAAVYGDGRWFVEFTAVTCGCGRPVTATAECIADPSCRAELTVDALECIDCPDLEMIGINPNDDVNVPAFDSVCLPSGEAAVTFQYSLAHTLPFAVTVDVDCGGLSTGGSGTTTGFLPNNPPQTVSVTCRYPTPLAGQRIVLWMYRGLGEAPLGCPPVVFQMPALEACPECQIDALPNVRVQSVQGCTATFSGDAAPPGCSFLVNFGEGNPNPEPHNSLNFTHTYAEARSDPYIVSITMVCGDCVFPLPGLVVDITDCRDDDPQDDADTDGGVVDPGTDDSPDESIWCGLLRSLAAVAAGIALFALAMILCIPAAWLPLLIVAAAAAVLSVIAGIVYALFCPNRPCNLALLVSAQALMGAGSALIVFSACCWWIVFVGIAAIGAGLVVLKQWRDRCKVSNCRAAAEVAFVFVTLLPQIATLVAAVAVLQPCYSPWANAILATIYAFITAYALKCDQ